MEDKIFGSLYYDYSWCGKVALPFFGELSEIDLFIHADDEEDEISEIQYEAYNEFLKNWDKELQEKVVKHIIEYYNKEERFSYGPDNDEEEFKRMWPELNTVSDMLKTIELDGLSIQSPDLLEDKLCVYLTFYHTWGDDTDDNGIGVEITGNEITDIGFRDIAY